MMRGRLFTSSSSPIGGEGVGQGEPAGIREAARPHGLPWALVVAAVMAVCFEAGYVYKFRYRFLGTTSSLSEIKRRVLTSDAPADDVAIFGNSRFYHVDPQRLKEVFGPEARITNYAWAWCGMEIYEAMLRGLIESGRAPRVLLVDGNPEIFGYRPDLVSVTGDPANQVRYQQTAPFFPALRVELAQELWGPAWQTLSAYLTPPSVAYGDVVGKGVDRLIDDRKLPKPRPDFDHIVGGWQEKGWFQFAPERAAPVEEFRQVEKVNGPYVLYINKGVLAAYERFLSLAQRNGIQVIMLPVPNNSLMYEAYEREGVFATYDAWLNEMQRRYPVFKAPAPRWQNWPGMLGDAGHLNHAGIMRHMDLMVEMLHELEPDLQN